MGTSMGKLFVDPKTLPGGACELCYDHPKGMDGHIQISKAYMEAGTDCPDWFNATSLGINTVPQAHHYGISECYSGGASFFGLMQVLFLLAAYFKLLSWSSAMIADGSELLLLVPSLKGIVGSVVLPILGAIPDGAMVLFSCLGNNARKSIVVGIGALAGSTIMLITLPWFLSILAGRVNMINGKPQYDRLGKGKSRLDVDALLPAGQAVSFSSRLRVNLFKTGVTAKPMIQANGRIMMGTSLVYLFIQIPAFAELIKNPHSPHSQAKVETKWVVISMAACLLTFVWYLVHCVRENNKHDEQKDGLHPTEMKAHQVQAKALDLGLMSIGTLFAQELEQEIVAHGNGVGTITSSPQTSVRLDSFLRKKFNQYDKDGSNTLELSELRVLFSDLGQSGEQQFTELMKTLDADNDGNVSFNEFKNALLVVVVEHVGKVMKGDYVSQTEGGGGGGGASSINGNPYEDGGADDDALLTGAPTTDIDADDDEEEEMPDDIGGLPPDKQMAAIIKRSLKMMTIGTVVVLLVSDPTVDLLSDLGDRLNIPAFVISFLLAPMASNASELVAAYSYAQKKTAATMQVSLSTLEGAGIMNNTFTTAIFFLGMYINKPSATNQGIEWSFTCETIGIVVVQLIVGFMAQKSVFRLVDGLVILTLFPLSLIGIMLLKNYTHLDGFADAE